ncbi:hypothetical protein AMTRI_Chr06g200330 [Amborella trichopoda]
MFLLHEYVLWAFLIISSVIPILAFLIFVVLAPISQGPEKVSSYELVIEPPGDAWIQFRILYYMFALVFVVFDVETILLYPWAMSFMVLGIFVFMEAFIIYIVHYLLFHYKRKSIESLFHIFFLFYNILHNCLD